MPSHVLPLAEDGRVSEAVDVMVEVRARQHRPLITSWNEKPVERVRPLTCFHTLDHTRLKQWQNSADSPRVVGRTSNKSLRIDKRKKESRPSVLDQDSELSSYARFCSQL